MNPSPHLIECVELSRELPEPEGRLLLDRVSFCAAKGEVVGVLGPSGAGKSTLLRLLNRLDEPSSGSVFLHGQNYRNIPPRDLRRTVGMIMQRAFLFPGTVADNIRFGPSQHHLQIGDAEIAELLEKVGLLGYEARDVSTLSGGEAQRVAITRALANEPQVLLLDEPTSALDEAAKLGVEAVLASLIRERHLTCIWVTHDPAQAARMADSVLMLEAGRVTAFGAARKLLGSAQEKS